MIKKISLFILIAGLTYTTAIGQEKKDKEKDKSEKDSAGIRIRNGITIPEGMQIYDSITVVSNKNVTRKKELISLTTADSTKKAKAEKKANKTSSAKGGNIAQTFSTNASIDAGRTAGSLDVSASGAATYTLPIAVPPGIGGVVPQVALTYNSQAGNGLAGYGWNISGLSSITRIPSTRFHDDYIGGINFDSHDRFALDGQRLILKSGTYGGDGAEYQTENYSNLKIISRGVSSYGASYGPAYFEVYSPDGSVAYYGYTSDSKSQTDFAISYSENSQGIRISYEYYLPGNVLVISSIKYGSKGSAQALNEIYFVWDERLRNEQVYVGGQLFVQSKILKEIQVNGNGTAFRNYVLTHDAVPTLQYQRLADVQELTGDKSKAFEPIYFTYTNTNELVASSSIISGLGFTGIAKNNSSVVTGDFTGNGRMDFILYPSSKDKFWTFWDPTTSSTYNLGTQYNTTYFKEILPVTWLTHNNKMLSEQGFAIVQYQDDSTVKFRVMSAGSVSPVSLQYEKVWSNAPTIVGYSQCTEQNVQGGGIDREFISGDFNGDGLTDVLAIEKPYTLPNETYIPDCPENSMGTCCFPDNPPATTSKVHFINLDRRLTSNFVNYAGDLSERTSAGDKFYAADFNGDGKADIVHITYHKMLVYALDASSQLSLLWQTSSLYITTASHPLFGDYNADGKMDVIISNDLGNTFYAFISSGEDFIFSQQTYPFMKGPTQYSGGQLVEYSLIANDINGDGKCDIVYTFTATNDNGQNAQLSVVPFHNSGISSSNSAPFFTTGIGVNLNSLQMSHLPHPIFLTSDKLNPKLELGLMSNNNIKLYEFQKDSRKDVELNAVTQDGVAYNIDYRYLDPNISISGSLGYQISYAQTFPYIDIQIAPGFKVVDKLRRNYSSIETRQIFGYKAAVSNTEGLGFLGFSEITRSNWHIDESDNNKLFTISIHDPLKRGALLKQFTSKYASVSSLVSDVSAAKPDTILNAAQSVAKTITASQSITLKPGFNASGANGTFIAKIVSPAEAVNDNSTISDYITRVDYTYDTSLSTDKVFLNKPTSVVTKDKLSSTNTVVAYTYDNYQNVTNEFSNFDGAGTKTVDITYDNSTGSSYYIGRPTNKKTTLNNGSDTYTTEEQYTHTGYLPTQIKKKGHNTAFITENLQYDTYGNVTQKQVVTAAGTRAVSTQYDASGRFVIKQTDAEGFETTYGYNTSNGNITSKTEPFNITSSYLYDDWGRLTESTNYLNKKAYIAYQKNDELIRITKSDDEGRESYTITTPVGTTKEVAAKNVLGQWAAQYYQYDAYDRQTHVSEPATSSANNQWNETVYDEYGRVSQTIAFTGKTTNITYSGLSTTVNDGTKSVTTTKNALGQTSSVQDPGGTINYTYFANGNLKTAGFDGSVQSIEQDGWGRKTKLTDPSAGMYTYTYNGFGEVTQETTPKGATNYTYDNNGKVQTKQITGDYTNMSYAYTYDGTSKLLTKLELTNTDGNNAIYDYTYDSYKRLSSVTEDNLHARFVKTLTYDAFGRVNTEASEAKNKNNNKTVSKTILNAYQNGELKSITDNTTAEKIWDVTAVNARGQVTTALLGASMKQTNTYDTYGFPQNLKTERITGTPAILMQLGYTFDVQRGNVTNRTNSVFSWSEDFTYDNLDRLGQFNDNNAAQSQTYDNKGRISNNSWIGNYIFNGSSYQQTGVSSITTEANNYYQVRHLQQITYNAFKSPVKIIELGKEIIDFQYNAAEGRSHMYYGDEATDKMNRRYRRHYSEDGSMEITEDITGNTTSFVFYMGGDAYDAPALWKEDYIGTSQTAANLYYLHRDHLGSINLITDNQGTVVEKRAFDAWGNIVKLQDGNGNNLTAFLITDRGYTGHEHLQGVALVHMNGRLYDSKLHRFLSPDNYVQDPTNTQNFNRYGYVYNNPLKYTDPNGEFAWLLPAIGAAVFGYLGGTAANDGKFNPVKWDWNSGKTWAGIGIGAASGALGGWGAAVGGKALAGTAFFGSFANGTVAAYGIAGTVAFGAAGYTTGFGTGMVTSGGDWGYANKLGGHYAGIGAAVGSVVGSLYGLSEQGKEYLENQPEYWASTDNDAFNRSPIGTPTTPSEFNIKKIGKAYYTNVYYEENFYDLRFTKGKLGINNINVPSMNIMFSNKSRFYGSVTYDGARTDLALAFNFVRQELADKIYGGEIKGSRAAGKYMTQQLNFYLGSWFSYADVRIRRGVWWNGTPKSNLVYIFR